MASAKNSQCSCSVSAFTRCELVVVLDVIAMLAIMRQAALSRTSFEAQQATCVNNLREIGAATRILASVDGDHLLCGLPLNSNLGPSCWRLYKSAAKSPSFLICPADERRPARNWTELDNNGVSYFFGIYRGDDPQAIIGGDRNLGPGTEPDPEYGYSPSNGQGKDVVITGPVCWSLKMHSRGNRSGAGNILLGDGSVQEMTSSTPKLNSARLVFP
jgi:hypothetical protein